jgi:hypothetical protein
MAVRNISGKKVHIISDPEGFKIPDVPDDEELYICGDLIDSVIKGKKDDFLELKSFNLYNIQKCIKKNNVFLAFGNRDLNKLKCRYLCELKTTTNEDANALINKFNNGNIELTYDNYNIIKNANPEWKENHKKWYPYWNTGNQIFKITDKDYEKYKKYWTTTSDDQKKNMFTHRYDVIFGLDPTVGTMSADNVIDAIAKEINLDLSTISEDEKQDYKAFVTLAIFKSMCMNSFQNYNLEIKNLQDIKNSIKVRGWLCEMYRKHQVCYMLLDDSTNVYLLSHGGISSKLILNPEILSNMHKALSQPRLNELISDSDKFYGAIKGGYYDKYANVNTENVNLTERINKINEIIKNSINSFITTGKPEDVKFLLTIATGFNCSNFTKLLIDPSGIDCKDLPTPSDIGPIMPGIESLRKSMFIMEGRTIYQIIGHKPIGMNTIVDLYESGDNKSILINLDISNTFMATNYNKLALENVSENKIIIENNTIKLDSLINMNLNVDDKKLTKTKIDDTIDLTQNLQTESTLFYSNKFTLPENILTIITTNTIDDEFINNIRNLGGTELSYNCSFYKNGTKYHLITKYPNWKMGIFIVNEDDFNKLKTPVPVQVGGYKQKYLKYKAKYLALSNKLKNKY